MTVEQIKQDHMKLRQEAEAQLDRKPPIFAQPNPGEQLLHELLHELSVHKIELEMQNEALRQSQVELERSRDRYVDLFDFSPVGYITLNHEGVINEINLTAAALLGVERSKLTHRRFAGYIAPADSDRWHRHFLSVLKSDQQRSCELAIQKNGKGEGFRTVLYCQRHMIEGKELVVRIVLAGITGNKEPEATQQQSGQ